MPALNEPLRSIIDRGSVDLPGSKTETPPEGLVLFTPETDDTGVRLTLFVTPEDRGKLSRGRGHRATIIDAPTGLEFDVESADCGAGCHCAARVRTIRFG